MKKALIVGLNNYPGCKLEWCDNDAIAMKELIESNGDGSPNFEVISIFEQKAYDLSKKYKNSSFKFIKINSIIEVLDKLIFWFAKKILKKDNSHSYRYIFQRLYFLNKCSKILNKNNYDKVLLENHPTQYLSLKWRKNYKKYDGRYYYHCHNEFPGTYGCKDIIAKTKTILCVSEFIANNTSNFLGMPINKFTILRNCINTSRFSKSISDEEKESLRKKYNINKDDKILLFTGRITKEKGVKELIESLKKVKYEKYKLLILGSALNKLKAKTKYQEEIEEFVKIMSDKIIFTGFIKYEDINKFYSLADIAVLPSIWNDPAPLTIIESLVSGLPIITTNSGGIPEYAINGSAIILNKEKDIVNELSKNIDDLLNDDNKLEEMSQIAKKVSKDLTLENYYESFCKIMMRN